MGSRNRSRRDVLKAGATVASIGVFGSLSGCSELRSDDTETPEDDSDKQARSVSADVPARADMVASIDFQTLLDDQALRDAVNEGLSEGQEGGDSEEGFPTSVEDALDRIQEETDVDPRQLNEVAMFAEASTDPESAYGGYVAYSGWAGELIRGRIEDAREEADTEKVETETYGEMTVYVLDAPEAEMDGRLTVFEDGTIVAGTGGAVHDVIDIRNDDGEAISGDLAEAWNASREGYVEFAVDVDMEDLPEEQTEDVPPALEAAEYSYGSVYPDGDVRGAAFNVETESESDAADLADLISEGRARALAEAEEAGEEDVVTFIEETTVTTDGTTVTIQNEVPVDDITPVVREFVRGFVSLYGEHGSNFGTGMYQ